MTPRHPPRALRSLTTPTRSRSENQNQSQRVLSRPEDLADSVSRRKTLFFRHKLSEPIKCQSPEGPASVRVHVRGCSYCRLLLQLTCHDHTDQFSMCVPTPELSKSTARIGVTPSPTPTGHWPGDVPVQKRQRPAPRTPAPLSLI